MKMVSLSHGRIGRKFWGRDFCFVVVCVWPGIEWYIGGFCFLLALYGVCFGTGKRWCVRVDCFYLAWGGESADIGGPIVLGSVIYGGGGTITTLAFTEGACFFSRQGLVLCRLWPIVRRWGDLAGTDQRRLGKSMGAGRCWWGFPCVFI